MLTGHIGIFNQTVAITHLNVISDVAYFWLLHG